MTNSVPVSVDPNTRSNANLIYILYLAGFVVPLVTGIAGLIMAYSGKGRGDAVLDSHYNNQINIFWKSLLYGLVSAVLTVVLIGFLLMLATAVWFIIRNVQGMQTLSAGQPIANPGSWWL
jgi:uncharacterized membrane protein